LVAELGLRAIVRNVNAIDGKLLKKPENIQQKQLANHNTLDAIEEFKFDACIGGARRDEEKQSQERNFSVRDDFGQWDEKNQLFDLLNGKIENGQNVRVSNFELDRADVWSYIEQEQVKFHRFIFRTSVKYSYVME
jgi:sulfate adenylyltransferase subunit 2